jgi:galacturonokinase
MNDITDAFIRIFGTQHEGYIRSPLRICPLGAHVDHQEGFVTGMALDVCIDFLYTQDEEGFVRVQSLDFPDEEYFHINRVPEMLPGFWGNYLRGAALALSREVRLSHGIKGVVKGRLPSAGLSTSASITTAFLLALCDVNDIQCSDAQLIEHSHWVETVYIGLNNGILDQAANILSRSGKLLQMDCRTNEWELIPPGLTMPPFEVVVVNSGFNKALISTDYNNRVDECKIAASILAELAGKMPKGLKETRLRDIEPAEWKRFREALPGRFARRAHHFFTEQDRVIRGVEAWRSGDLALFGALMNQSGDSSVENYQCGCPELITIFEILKRTPGVYGARFSGAGYRGCCVGIVDPSQKKVIRESIARTYPAVHPQYMDKYSVFFCSTADGAAIIESCRNQAQR